MALSALQRRDLRVLAILRGFSFLGDAIALITLFLRVSHAGRGWLIAALSIAGALPLVLLSPVAGYVVDHVAAKSFLAALGGFEALVCVGIGYWHGDTATIVLLALLSCGVAFSVPGYSALVPSISGEENVALAQSTLQSVQGVAMTAGPVLGGLLVGATGQSWPLYLDAASFAVAGLATLTLRSDRRFVKELAHATKEKRDLAVGVRLCFRDPMLRPVVVTGAIFMLALGAVNVAEVFFITRTLHASALAYGLTGAAFGGGTIAGSLASRRLSQDVFALVRTALVGIALVGVLISSVGLVERVGYVFPLLALTGIAVGIVNVAASTIFTVRTPEALRGRVFAATGAIFTSAEIGSMVLGGALLSALAPRTVFQLAGAVATATVVILGPLELRTSRRVHHNANVA